MPIILLLPIHDSLILLNQIDVALWVPTKIVRVMNYELGAIELQRTLVELYGFNMYQ